MIFTLFKHSDQINLACISITILLWLCLLRQCFRELPFWKIWKCGQYLKFYKLLIGSDRNDLQMVLFVTNFCPKGSYTSHCLFSCLVSLSHCCGLHMGALCILLFLASRASRWSYQQGCQSRCFLQCRQSWTCTWVTCALWWKCCTKKTSSLSCIMPLGVPSQILQCPSFWELRSIWMDR